MFWNVTHAENQVNFKSAGCQLFFILIEMYFVPFNHDPHEWECLNDLSPNVERLSIVKYENFNPVSRICGSILQTILYQSYNLRQASFNGPIIHNGYCIASFVSISVDRAIFPQF